ncbi:acetyl-CoA carboxylase carboxyl transferase subunit alpha, partial [candidate division KSB1 bacterium]|nr:acetyl-CoA carboxylase carboxyl transferase subunit alpha [candidate division KSB1 bacterium]
MQGFILDFEKPIIDLEKKIKDMQDYAASEGVDLNDEIVRFQEKAQKLQQEIYSKL